jgi:hypothetical protein
VRAAAVLLLVLAGADQDKVAITFRPAKGETMAAKDALVITGKAKLVVNGVEDEIGLESERRRSYSVAFGDESKVLKVEDDGTRTRSGPEDEWDRIDQPLHGKTVTVRLTNGATVIEGIEKPDEATKRALTLAEPEADWWPAEPVAVGGTWASEKGGVVERLLDLAEPSSKLTFTLKEMKKDGDRPLAVIGVKGTVSGKSPNGTEYALTLEGELTAAADRGLVLSMKLAGKAKLHRKSDTIQVDAEGAVSVERNATLK